MCGIIGIVGASDVSERLLDGLRRLEYRGYDSAGIATIHDGHFDRRRAEGKLGNLARSWPTIPCPAGSASPTPAGRRTARRPRTTPTRTSSGR